MNRMLLPVLLAPGVVAACQETPRTDPGAPSGASSSVVPSRPMSSAAAQDALDALDTRVAVPLLPMMANHQKQNMRDHLVAVHEIVTATDTKDFAAIEKAARRIGYSEQMGQMCNHMGAGAPGFTDMALEFHHSADRIADAAGKQDMDAVWKTLGKTLATCTGCHATFKQHVVDDATWAAATKRAAPTQ